MIALGGPTLKPDDYPDETKAADAVSMIALGGPTLKLIRLLMSSSVWVCLNDSTGRAYTETVSSARGAGRRCRLNDSTGRAYTETPQSRDREHAELCLNDSTGRAYTETMTAGNREIKWLRSQ